MKRIKARCSQEIKKRSRRVVRCVLFWRTSARTQQRNQHLDGPFSFQESCVAARVPVLCSIAKQPKHLLVSPSKPKEVYLVKTSMNTKERPSTRATHSHVRVSNNDCAIEFRPAWTVPNQIPRDSRTSNHSAASFPTNKKSTNLSLSWLPSVLAYLFMHAPNQWPLIHLSPSSPQDKAEQLKPVTKFFRCCCRTATPRRAHTCSIHSQLFPSSTPQASQEAALAGVPASSRLDWRAGTG